MGNLTTHYPYDNHTAYSKGKKMEASKTFTRKELASLRASAQRYAYSFLAKKYREEYSELYAVYLSNRGHNIKVRRTIIDERLLAKGNKK